MLHLIVFLNHDHILVKRNNAYSKLAILCREKNVPLLNSFIPVQPITFNHVKHACIKNLCNDCFGKTFKRQLICGICADGIERDVTISVVDECGETLESISAENEILGKGTIHERRV